MVEGSRLRAVAELVEATPFDTVVTVLRGQARDHPEDAPDLLAIAAWCAVIRDDLPTATKLARAARAALDARINDRPDRTLRAALSLAIAALDGA